MVVEDVKSDINDNLHKKEKEGVADGGGDDDDNDDDDDDDDSNNINEGEGSKVSVVYTV